MRMLHVLHSIEHGRSCMHQARSPIIGHGPQFPPAGAIFGYQITGRRELPADPIDNGQLSATVPSC